MSSGDGSPRQIEANRLLLEALTAKMREMMIEQTEAIHARIDQLENQQNNTDEEERARRRRMGRPREERLSGIKIKVPTFQWKNDPEAYLEWETKIEQILLVTLIVMFKKCRL